MSDMRSLSGLLKLMGRLGVLIALPMLTGCAINLDKNYSDSDAGMFVLSIRADNDEAFDRYYLGFKKTDVSSFGVLDWRRSNFLGGSEKDFFDSTLSGEVFIRKIPPGRYKISFLGLQSPLTRGSTTETFDPPITFTVNPHETAYLGEVNVVPVCYGGPFGFKICRFANIDIQDRAQRDIDIARTKKPDLYPASTALLKPEFRPFRFKK